MYSAIQIADYIVARCLDVGSPISNLQLNKIIYFIQKAFLNTNGYANGLFAEDFEAWQFGPVVPNVYYRYCGFGGASILLKPMNLISLSIEETELVNDIIDRNCIRQPWELVKETHKPNGAWDRVFRNGYGNHVIIPKALIKQHG